MGSDPNAEIPEWMGIDFRELQCIMYEFNCAVVLSLIYCCLPHMPGYFAPLALGLSMGGAVENGAEFGGGMANPIFVMARYLRGELRGVAAFRYAALLVVGTIWGATLAGMIYGFKVNAYPVKADGVSEVSTFFAELLYSFGLTLVYLVVTKRREVSGAKYAGAAVGAFYTAATIVPAVGVANPALACLALVNGLNGASGFVDHLETSWMFFAGPVAGALLASKAVDVLTSERPKVPMLFAEFTGAFFLGLTAAMNAPFAGGLGALGIAAVLVAMMYVSSPVAGPTALNPAGVAVVALRSYDSALIPTWAPVDAALLVATELAGTVAGAGVAAALLQGAAKVATPMVADDTAWIDSVLAESLGASLPLWFLLDNMVGPNDPRKNDTTMGYAAMVGSAAFTGMLLFHGATGAALNPALGLMSLVSGRHMKDIWVYFVGPLLGGLTALNNLTLFRHDELEAEEEAAKNGGADEKLEPKTYAALA